MYSIIEKASILKPILKFSLIYSRLISQRNRILKSIRGYSNIDGWLTENEAIGLYQISKKLPKNATIVEIGTWQGKSTYCIAKGVKSGRVYAIDPFNADGGYDKASETEYKIRKEGVSLIENFKTNMNNLKVLKKITIKEGYSYNFHNDFQKIDFLFIDGDHSIDGCKRDFDLYSHKVTNGGFIAFHDYHLDRSELGPTYVINKYVIKSDDFIFFKQFDSLWVGKKIT
jgi:predicted O-methyltransferase YrrM